MQSLSWRSRKVRGYLKVHVLSERLAFVFRYREQVKEGASTNYGRAKQHYTKANHLEMRNGRPFNMLAILAKMNNRKFEAVYYHVRCLASRNAFQSSKEGLVSIFEEMKRRWEMTEKKKVEERREGEKEREGRRIVRGSKVS